MTDLNDAKLIKWFKKNLKNINYISILKEKKIIKREKIIENIECCVSELNEDRLLHKQMDILKKLWKNLVACSIIFLKFMDKREEYHDDGDYGLEDLDKYFNDFSDFEPLLYGNSIYYRDHLSHSFKVFLLGEYMIKEELITNEGSKNFGILDFGDEIFDEFDDINSTAKKKNPFKVSVDEKEAIWTIIALTHDIGYPLEKFHQIFNKIRSIIENFNIESVNFTLSQQNVALNENIVKLISSNVVIDENRIQKKKKRRYTTHIQPKYLWKFSRALENFDHGIESCILLYKTLVFFLETDYSLEKSSFLDANDAKQFLIRRNILRTIASHNCNFIYYLKFCDIAFFLKIVDEIQDWKRPNLKQIFDFPPEQEVGIISYEKKGEPSKDSLISFYFKYKNNNKERLEKSEKKDMHKKISQIFGEKCRKYIEILRSAVGGNKRDFILKFEVQDEIDENHILFEFEHRNPSEIYLFKTENNKEKQEINMDEIYTLPEYKRPKMTY